MYEITVYRQNRIAAPFKLRILTVSLDQEVKENIDMLFLGTTKHPAPHNRCIQVSRTCMMIPRRRIIIPQYGFASIHRSMLRSLSIARVGCRRRAWLSSPCMSLFGVHRHYNLCTDSKSHTSTESPDFGCCQDVRWSRFCYVKAQI